MEPEQRTTSSLKNRRRSRRTIANNLAKVECRKGALGFGLNLTVTTLDLSETGIRLLLKVPLDPGQDVEVLIHAPGLAKPIKRLGQVIWAVPAADGRCCVGLCLEKALRYADLYRLAKPF